MSEPMDAPCDLSEWIKTGLPSSDAVKVKFARLSKIVYLEQNKRWKALRELNADNRDSSFWIIKHFNSVDFMTVYDIGCKKVIIAFRGTDIEDKTGNKIRDLQADGWIATGRFSSSARFKEAVEITESVLKNYKDVIVTGHSLGGKLAFDISKKFGLPAIVFNMGSSPLNVGSNDKSVHFNTNKSGFDYLSASSYYLDDQKTVDVVKKLDNSHTIDNFI